MTPPLRILYRGPLASCNYGCAYCPFAKRVDSRAELAADRRAWERLLDWVERLPPADLVAIFVTPWGEALIRRWYQEGLARLSRLPQVTRAAVQTNLSGRLDWLSAADPGKLGLWCTYHPAWTPRARFLARCRRLDRAGVRYSVGVVGLPEHHSDAVALRAELRPEVYVWVNAVKSSGSGYDEAEARAWERIDPLFRLSLARYPSLDRACRAGRESISVDGDGTMRRCHFIREPIGNLYEEGWREALRPRPCTKDSCDCHIGYVNLEYLELDKVFGSGILERVPEPSALGTSGSRREASSRLL